ncbi:MAG: hypothetical protein GXP08_07815 [Gammaproteobacteria bacterium]|nr:hypothetical protein [Gammaproteobacteria bacterium]
MLTPKLVDHIFTLNIIPIADSFVGKGKPLMHTVFRGNLFMMFVAGATLNPNTPHQLNGRSHTTIQLMWCVKQYQNNVIS